MENIPGISSGKASLAVFSSSNGGDFQSVLEEICSVKECEVDSHST